MIDDGSCIFGGEGVTISILTDNYPGETTWSLTDGSGAVVASGGPYATAGVEEVTEVCVSPGCYTFTINDSFGDGICCAYGTGSTRVFPRSGLASGGNLQNGEHGIVLGSGFGCTDERRATTTPKPPRLTVLISLHASVTPCRNTTTTPIHCRRQIMCDA